jgi:hypothetical protein
MNKYILEFEKDGKIEGASISAVDDDEAIVKAIERVNFLREVYASINNELRHPELYRVIDTYNLR